MKAEASVKFQCQLHKSNGKGGEPKGAAAAMSEEFYGFLVFISVLHFFYAKIQTHTHTHTCAHLMRFCGAFVFDKCWRES